ncbi:FAD binding domain-containing protein [Rhodospirillaceae bacterium SYSU D60014]|uniref:FAD binding domain-containing protein n=1 Tax=Virgifigura deserti TaxID=2268457 RepID=UPI000E66ED85
MRSYFRPVDLSEALALLVASPLTVIAGGTDYYPARVGRPIGDDVLDITGLRMLRGIVDEGDHVRVGALTTWTDLIEARLPPWFDGYKLAAREVGGMQIQNAGTLCGNLCNASPAADGTPNLLALDAEVVLSSVDGERRVPVAEFVTGNRRTIRRPDELVTALLIPKPAPDARQGTRSTWLKLGARRYLVISIVMVAAVLEAAPDGTVGRLRVAIGSCSAVARRLFKLERDLIGLPLNDRLAERVTTAHLAPLSPIDDVRGTAAYRRDAALVLVRRALNQLTEDR